MGGNNKINRNGLAFLLVYIDLLGIGILFFTILIIKYNYSRLNKSFKEKNILINQYTINVKNLKVNSEKTNINDEINSLIEHFEGIMKNSKLEGKIDNLESFVNNGENDKINCYISINDSDNNSNPHALNESLDEIMISS